MSMAASEMKPLLEELKNTPSRVIHKRLQDVAEMVAHLQAKWHQGTTGASYLLVVRLPNLCLWSNVTRPHRGGSCADSFRHAYCLVCGRASCVCIQRSTQQGDYQHHLFNRELAPRCRVLPDATCGADRHRNESGRLCVCGQY